MKNNNLFIGMVMSVILFMGSCNDKETLGPDPYAGGKEPLGIRFAEAVPSPSEGREGTAMTFKVYGIQEEYKEKMQFLINGIVSDITEVTDSTITAILPENVSTGGTRLVVEGQIYPGPLCRVSGNVSLDPTFNAGAGTNGMISVIKQLSNGRILLGGSFTDYNGFSSTTEINGLARISANGEYASMNFGLGAEEGAIRSIHELNGGDLLISGSISTFNENELLNNVTILNADGSLKLEEVEILNLTSDPEKSKLSVPTFNGGTNLPIMKTFVHGNTVTALGSFSSYNDYFYERSTYDNVLMGLFQVGGIVRTDMKGMFDETFNINHALPPAPGQPRPPANTGLEGIVNDGHMQNDGKLIVVGSFNRYNDETVAGNIIRINTDGSRDATFNPGSGASDAIYTITATSSGKYLLTGFFESYGGQPANGVVLLNADGSLDPSFRSLGFTGGRPTFVRQLSSGKILVAGSFKRYGDVIREGLCILNPDGTLAQNYNNTGKLDGLIMDALEGTNSMGRSTITLVGFISSFNGKSNIGNIMRLAFTE